ncbi:MAG: GDSL-type esterase/lipase family protein [Lactobacillaceae bacterium]|jgi:lysophospholipase L1-like esterase|nr:GDSL-type esterase/lipase family protein [Lactobacillaceae bacterium]
MNKIFKSVLSLLIFMLIVPTVQASDLLPKKQRKATINLVAVGDSLTEGVGDTTNQQGYTKRTAAMLKATYKVKVKTANFGKAGDRSDQILKRLKKNPKAVKALDKADVIVMTVGGNDLQQTLFDAVFAKNAASVTKVVNKSIPTYTTKLQKLVNYLRQTNTKAPIFLFGNYNPLYVYFANRPELNHAVQKYNAVNITTAGLRANMYYVSTFKTLTYGQYTTDAARDELVKTANMANAGSVKNKVVSKTLDGKNKAKNIYITNQDYYHPNNSGYDRMSALLVKSMMEHQKGWLKK